MNTKEHGNVERRDFLKTAATAATAFSILPARTVFGLDANNKVEIGIAGCGGRGSWIGRLFEQHGNAKVVAVHDYFKDRTDRAREMFSLAPERCHNDLDGYKALVAGTLDAVAVESPPYFHPEQAVATLDAGKHLYLAKPIAVDVPGCMAIVEAAKRTSGRLCAWVDFQTRANEFFQGAAERIHQGFIGKPVSGQFYYYCGRLNTQSRPGPETARLRNWVFDIALSGDIIVEQNIHVLDVANWYLQGHPVKAAGTGGRKARADVGDCWDHFVVTYTYPDEVLVDFSSGQFTYGYDDLCMRLYGSEGTVDSHYGGEVFIRGKNNSWEGGKTNTIYESGAVANIEKFCDSIRKNSPIDNTLESAHSTMTSILGRMAAYQRREVTWEEMVAANEALDPRLNLPADGPAQPPDRG
ncbi:MAG: Inositol 2-dehydrogenase/D-chiro-inositol 3-dehydrogenase [Candidatus Hydrogenedentes bacterium ADurb.Bin101]|nr:MAG: Inositol 2-dehydrogenase/D-chiro-inositol 3-dehydrogenase [Candidatus Hydrogenedentes bacterium ADurb.Bin101]